ncbi:methyltransferase [Janthinobacterium agaricidamnosum]|uniref:Thiopurine S-methyltransferase family protein n=1 Tax=Janthinobacterium agaricidamnosum NBRC 102515 = DSM 9628 TaxID=1349767 RepID=W0V9H5_9BURK|nr:methyltransferase [Janthinobacterium agaricidamnosum]CDG85454.1 thiopurine S-methyltransferase family protein [Janthinobacterium agaricidamnosum NBRC 102515 = DSM 9628]
MGKFEQRDPLSPGFWDERFKRHFMPWDHGGVPAALRRFVQASGTAQRCLIPGCGSAYELAFMSNAGWDATAIDFAPAAVSAARAAAGQWGGRVLEADFFAFEPARPLDLIYERAFLCAMPRAMWPKVAARWAQLLAPGALLAGYFFFDQAIKGPPFGIERAQLDSLLQTDFECIADQPADDSIPVFAGKERWMIWRRRQHAVSARLLDGGAG